MLKWSIRPRWPGVWPWALLVLVMCTPHQTAAQTPPTAAATAQDNSTTVVSTDAFQPVALQSLFNVQIDRVVFQTKNFTLVPAAWQYVSPDTPYVLDRNFTILSDATPPTILDWSFISRKIVMVPGTSFAFDRLVLLNTRRLRTLYFSWFLNSPGAVLTIQDSIMVDPVCNATDSQQDLQSAQSLPQLPGKPRNVVTPSQPLCLALPTGTECFQHGVHMQMLTVVLGSASRADQDAATTPAQAAAAAAAGHFVIQYRNTTRVCRQYLDPQCLQENGGNRTLCWERAFTGQQQDGSRAGPSSAGGAAMTTGAIAGAVVGGVCGFLLLLAAALLGLRQRSNGGGKAALLSGSSSSPSGKGPQGPTGCQGGDVEGGSVRGLDPSTRGLLAAPLSGRCSVGEPPRPSFGRDGLHLGVLLGAGSYGRVYKGRWHGRDVAIKVVHCSPDELPRVLREAEIMLQVDHPNVVHALNCILPNKSAAPKAPAQQHGPTSRSNNADRSGRQSADGTGSSSGGGGDSRRPSSTTSVTQMLPILRRHGSGSGGGSRPRDGAAAGAAAGQAAAGPGHAAVDSSDRSSPAGHIPRPGSAAAAADHQTFQQQQQQQQQQQWPAVAAAEQPGLHVLTVATTGSDLEHTPGSTGRLDQQQQQQQRHTGTDDEALAEEEGPESVAEVWLVLELCTGGNLQDSFRQHRDGFDMARLLCRLAEVAQGMAHLHSKQIMHGDLKAANVLLVNSVHGSFGQIAKLTDFGLAGVLRNGVTHHTTQHLGTITHCAPEILQDGRLSPAADVYAFGIMMWELYTSSTAFKDLHYGTIIQRVVLGGHRPPIPPDTPEDYALLMEACWAPDPADRPAFDQVLQCLTIMLHSLDAGTATTNAVNVVDRASPRTSLEGADAVAGAVQPGAAAGGGVGVVRPAAAAAAAGAAADSPCFKSPSVGSSRQGSSNIGSFDMCSRTVSMCSSQAGASSNPAAGASATAAAGGGSYSRLQPSSSLGTSSGMLSGLQPDTSLGTSSGTFWLNRLQAMSSMGSGDMGASPAAAAAAAAAGGGGQGDRFGVSPGLQGREGLTQYVRKGSQPATPAARAPGVTLPSAAAAAAGTAPAGAAAAGLMPPSAAAAPAGTAAAAAGTVPAGAPAAVLQSLTSFPRPAAAGSTQAVGGATHQPPSRRRSSEGSSSWVVQCSAAQDAAAPLDQQQQHGLLPQTSKAAAGGGGRGPAGSSSSSSAAAAARWASTGNMYTPSAGIAGIAAAGGGPGVESQQQQQQSSGSTGSAGAAGSSKLSQLKTPDSRHIQDLW